MRIGLFLIVAVAAHFARVPGCAGDVTSGRKIAFFENRIRPVLVAHCYECHSSSSDELGGNLLVDSREGLLGGGESGPAIKPRDVDASTLLHALRYDGLEMPPSKPLPEQVVSDFETWIRDGAVDPREPTATNDEREPDPPKKATSLWSLQPIQDPAVPEVRDSAWCVDPIDRFIMSRLEQEQITPTSDVDARTLVRRLSYDLTGLPPSYDQAARFVAASEADPKEAVAQLVDDLLASPQFGERWGRHWLDVARYAESNGNDGLSRNAAFPHAWRYRDYVIDSFNKDRPFDQFLIEQIAGDLLAYEADEERDRHLVATGFLALGAKPAKAMNNNFAMDVVADQLDLIGKGVIGLSIGCARCHDHKFDPIPTRDYYAMAGIFTSTETMWGLAANEKLTAPPTDLHVLTTAERRLPPIDFVETVVLKESATGLPKKIPKPKWTVGTPLAMGVRDRKPADCKINVKGDAKKLGDAVPRGFLSAIATDNADGVPKSNLITIDPDDSGRLQLANWLVSPNHPLTARVFVNRVWSKLFGHGLVRTPDDFGVYGEPPSHPELLDHLATRFVKSGWSIKELIRSIVLTRTYQLASSADESLVEHDPENRLLARHTRRRLDAEEIRDGMLHASGRLDLSPGRGSIIEHRDILINIAGNLHQPTRHRSVYLCYLRSSPPPELAAFDLPEFASVTGQREQNARPAQALYLLNNPFVQSQAKSLAECLIASFADDHQRARDLFRRTFGRDGSAAEHDSLLQLVNDIRKIEDEVAAWTVASQSMMATIEFRYVD